MSLKDLVILSKLGEGAYSSVYKVQRVADSQIYALKKVKMNNLSDKEQENALNEVRILASIKSQYIIGYKQAFVQSNSLCIVMQFSDDGDLYQKIVAHQKEESFFPEEQIWRTLLQLTMGLKKLHDLNILHRDLKSANVFLSKNGVVKLGDMNVSKIAKNGLLYTQTGTPYYASPQVWKDKPYDSKSDIWSLGCVIYEMTTLRPPFRAQDMDGLYKKVIKGSYSKIGQNYSKHLAGAIKMMLQVNPANRPDADQLLSNLAWKAEELNIPIKIESNSKEQLLRTIRANKNLHYLTDRLPKSNYQGEAAVTRESKAGSQNAKQKTSASTNISLRGINLPHLDRIILKNSSNKLPALVQERKHQIDHRSLQGMLRVEGKSQHRQDSEYEQKRGRDIKAQLQKIYNLRPSPKKSAVRKRVVELPRIK